ncbi:dihydropteroate synthase [soil metagenome]
MYTLNCKGRLITIDGSLVMGILNVNNDSFYAASRTSSIELILKKAHEMLNEGADILDIGGQSTRPGSALIQPDEELQRVIPSIERIKKKFPEAVISIDTFYAGVARDAVAAGASIINDVSGGQMDSDMIATAGLLNVPYVCMHMKGTPQTMNEYTNYENVTKEMLEYFVRKVAECRKAGIKDVIIDPGFGFAKNVDQNFTLLKNLAVFKMTDVPIMVGLSRKSTVYRTLQTTAEHALNGTTVMHTLALLNGADILRVHDVKEAKEVIRLVKCYQDNHD